MTYHAECSLKVICEQLSSLLAENVGKARQLGKASYHSTPVMPSTDELSPLLQFLFMQVLCCKKNQIPQCIPDGLSISSRQRYLWESFPGGHLAVI